MRRPADQRARTAAKNKIKYNDRTPEQIEKDRTYQKAWREENKEHVIEYSRIHNKIYRENNKDSINKKHKIYYEENKETLAAKNIIYLSDKRDDYNAKCRYYRKNSPTYKDERWQELKPEEKLFKGAKSRAKTKGYEFNLELHDINIPVYCPLLNIELVPGIGKPHGASPTLDRIDSSRGYIKGNVRVISNKANGLKRDMSIEFLEKLISYIKGEI